MVPRRDPAGEIPQTPGASGLGKADVCSIGDSPGVRETKGPIKASAPSFFLSCQVQFRSVFLCLEKLYQDGRKVGVDYAAFVGAAVADIARLPAGYAT